MNDDNSIKQQQGDVPENTEERAEKLETKTEDRDKDKDEEIDEKKDEDKDEKKDEDKDEKKDEDKDEKKDEDKDGFKDEDKDGYGDRAHIYRTYNDLPNRVGETVRILGWLRKIRTAGKIVFMEINGGFDQNLQVVMPKKYLPRDSFVESYILVLGKINKLPEGAHSYLPVELLAEEMQILGGSSPEYPSICPPQSGAQTRLEQRHLYLRDPHFSLITKLRAQLLQAIRLFFDRTDCTEIIPPCFTATECEGGATLFRVSHPGKSSDKPQTAYLTQSSQFALEMAVPAIGNCYCIWPSFRAEHSHTRRHLTEFVHVESEWSGILTFEDHLNHLRKLIHGILENLLVLSSHMLEKLDILDRVRKLEEMGRPENILVLSHEEAIAELKKRKIYKDVEKEEFFCDRDDIPEAQERQLIDAIGKIVFLTRFPKEFKSFYMALDPEDESRVLGCDVEVPGVGEIIGSGVRESNLGRLLSRLEENHLDPADYSEYLDLRKYGFGRTSGMGLGLDRMLTWIIGSNSIRDVVTFPRFPGYLRP